ncbi:MAG: ketoacyl-ACP synthase III [Lentimicrobiaceae bacterium]|nr:ketoacyl-ACP synthase III [Lentimicrobiaceae bacterium]
MAFLEIKNVALRGVAACVPAKTIRTENLPIFKNDEAEKFIKTTGIESRRIGGDGVCTSDLCFTAAEKLIKELNWNKSEIDALIFVSNTPDYRSPATSCILQDKLKLPTSCFTFDISAVCAGFIQGLTVISSILSSGTIKKALLLVGDTNSLTSSPEDKSRYPLLGDAGTATAWEYDKKAEKIYSNLLSDGSCYEFVISPDSGFRHFVTPESFIIKENEDGIRRAPIHGIMNGMEVFSFAISECPKAIKSLCEHYNINIHSEVDFYLFHQANMKINSTIGKKLKLEEKKIPSNIQWFGNTSCAAIPLLMVTNIREDISKKPLSLLLCAIGAGFVWSSAYIKTNNIVCPELLEL